MELEKAGIVDLLRTAKGVILGEFQREQSYHEIIKGGN